MCLCVCGDYGFVGLIKGGVVLFDVLDFEVVYGWIWFLKEGYVKCIEYEGVEKCDV